MTVKTLTKDDFTKFIDEVIKGEGQVYGITPKGEKHYDYSLLTDASKLALDYDVAVNPPKKFFTPPTECLLKFAGGKAESVFDDCAKVLVGVHTYDLKAINQMDEVFAEGENDVHYQKRRAQTTIIALEPTRAHKRSFWSSMNASTVDNGFDLLLTDLGDKYAIEIGTKKGEELLKKYAKASEATDSDLKTRDEKRSNLNNLCEQKVNVTSDEIPMLLKKAQDHGIWEEKSKKCYSCGTCNLVCPTCYCFDVRDEVNLDLKGGERKRYWDGCLLADFASVGSGENFREHKADRFKHRLNRKGYYLYDKFNDLFCVGCGRCSQSCLPDIADPVDILNKIKESL